jgi:F-type H+-transporting ATPase subunit epsilon
MAKAFPFKLITPKAVVFQGDAELVIGVGTEGEEGILASHAPFLTALKPGVLRANVIVGDAPQRLEFATSEGFMQALPERVTVLVDAAFAKSEIDLTAAREDLASATERQKAFAPQTPDFEREQAAIDFANAKIALVS